ncbi:hypothetical protein HDV01_007173 [Terramyces sp. JEL0728]|nr:hypothetical protein HDV01_007173 [Terramyces sp. JEL0728]
MQVEDIEELKPCVAMYCPINVKDIEKGKEYLWCSCGLSKSQPWCDESCAGTEFKPLKWVPTKDQDSKYTKDPPICDAFHTKLPLLYLKQIKDCKQDHTNVKICSKCGWAKDSKFNE